MRETKGSGKGSEKNLKAEYHISVLEQDMASRSRAFRANGETKKAKDTALESSVSHRFVNK